MGKREYAQKKLSELGVFATGADLAYGTLTDITKFQVGSTSGLEAQSGGMGTDGPSDITQSYTGATLTLEAKEQNSIDKLFAYIQCETVAAFVGLDPRLKFPAFFWFNQKDPLTMKRVRSWFVWNAMLQGEGEDVGDQPGNQQFQFTATLARRFHQAIMVDQFTGNASPVTTLAPTKTTMIAWKDLGVTRYALQILRYNPTTGLSYLSVAAGDFTETSSGITLAVGLGTGEKAMLAYLCAAY